MLSMRSDKRECKCGRPQTNTQNIRAREVCCSRGCVVQTLSTSQVPRTQVNQGFIFAQLTPSDTHSNKPLPAQERKPVKLKSVGVGPCVMKSVWSLQNSPHVHTCAIEITHVQLKSRNHYQSTQVSTKCHLINTHMVSHRTKLHTRSQSGYPEGIGELVRAVPVPLP